MVRIVEISRRPYLPPQAVEDTGTSVYTILEGQAPMLSWPGKGAERWGTQFATGQVKTPVRVRLHTASVHDAPWIGRTLEGPGLGVQNPGFFSTDEILPERMVP